MISAKVKTTYKGQDQYDAFMKRMKKLKGSYVSIGVHEGAGAYDSGIPVFQVAIWNEFGNKQIPEHAFFRTALDGHESEINSWREELLKQVMDGKITEQKALASLGFRIQVLIQNQIKSNMPPENAPSTVAAKVRDGVAPETLIWSGLMLRSITFQVVMK